MSDSLTRRASREARREENRILLDALLGPMREKARELGYALAVHGSLARDIDLVAVPWVAESASAQDLMIALLAAVHAVTGGIGWMDRTDGTQIPTGEAKPHGRRAWSIFLGELRDGPYLDISVVPRVAP